ncbi:MAG: inorganic phosphate transporter [Planctomycetota bacterium]
MDIYLGAIFILLGLAITDLIVGVSNDAVNFLNSSIGSRVAPRHIIMIIASLGMMAGVTFSSGMMEVARKGIFHPQLFTMPELMVLFLAVMLTDILLLDLYNTFGLPTSTTVSIVFELLGAAMAVSVIKITQAGENLGELVNYINTGKALAIIFGILLSVVISFITGAVVQYLTRLLFTFNFQKRVRLFGAAWGGVALTSIIFFILIKGAKGAAFLTPEATDWIHSHTAFILILSFVAITALLQVLMWFTRINILKIIVLAGTFALAMAFAANDLVNFIGVPLASMNAYQIAQQSDSMMTQTMDGLAKSVHSNLGFLLLAGLIMVVTLWVSRKARTVTRTEVNLSRQEEGLERFEATTLSQTIVRFVTSFFAMIKTIVPGPVQAWAMRRFHRAADYRPAPDAEGKVASFDLVRASVNLVVASTLISVATSLKLPLSTTYVTFMVAMGTSLADHAWGRESAVFRVTGVLMVIGGWFFTAFMAFTVASIFATIIYFGEVPAVIAIVIITMLLIIRNRRIHRTKEKDELNLEVFNLRKIQDSKAAIHLSFQHAGLFLREIRQTLSAGFEGLIKEDLQQLRVARKSQKMIQQWTNIITANVFKVLRLLQREDVENTQRYAQTISSLQEITESQRDIVMRAYTHVANNHSGLLEGQIKELQMIHECIDTVLARVSRTLREKEELDFAFVEERLDVLKNLIREFDMNQIMRIQDNTSKTRLSILFYGFIWNAQRIVKHTHRLLSIFSDPIATRGPRDPGKSNRTA